MIQEFDKAKAAIFIDYENVGNKRDGFLKELAKTLLELDQECMIQVRRAYGDWGRYAAVKHDLAKMGFELIELPSGCSGKNRADMKLTVDAMETALTRNHIGRFVIVSGDSDFVPLAAKLLELDREVWWIANSENSSKLIEPYATKLFFYKSEPTSQPQSKTEALPVLPSNAQKKNAQSNGPELNLRPEFLGQLAWSALAAYQQCQQEYVPLNGLFVALRRLYPNTVLSDEFGKSTRPHRVLGRHLDAIGLIKLKFEAKRGGYWFALGAETKFQKAIPKPPDFEIVAEELAQALARSQWLKDSTIENPRPMG